MILFDSFVSFHIYLICDFLKISFTVNWKTYNINEIYDCADFHLHNLNAKEILFQKFSTRSAPALSSPMNVPGIFIAWKLVT